MSLNKHILLLFTCLLLSAGYFPLYSQYMVKQVSNIDGLSNSSINCIYEDSDNILWLGTWDGLNAYDGREVKAYRHNKNNPHSISNNIIRQIVEQDSIHLWIATDGGLNRWNKHTQHFERFFENLGGFHLGITTDKKTVCYAHGIGLFYFDEEQEKFIKIDYGLTYGIKKMCVDSSDNVYILSGDGTLNKYSILRYDGIISLIHRVILEDDAPMSDIYLHDNKLAISYQNKIVILNAKTMEKLFVRILEGKSILQIEHNDRFILIRYSEGGCAKYDLHNNKLINIDNISDEVSIFAIHIGSQDICWIGTDGQGVMKVYEYTSPFKTVDISHPVRSFCEAGNGYIWIGTKGEGLKLLNKSSGQIVKSLTVKDGLNSNSVYAIRKNKYGDVFVGTDGHGLNIIPRGSNRIEQLIIPEKYKYFSSIYSILITHNDSQLWLGTAGYGLIRISLHKDGEKYVIDDVKEYISSPSKASLHSNTIYSIVKGENDDELWIGTRNGGVTRFDVRDEVFERLENICTNIKLTNNDILSLTMGASGNLWIGTSYGLNQLVISADTMSIVEYATDEKYLNNTIHGVLEDKNSNLWLSSNHGIFFLDIQTGEVTNYTSRNGLQNDEFSDGAYYIDSKGTLFFGGVGGLSYFDADEMHLRNYVPNIKLSNLKINNVNQNIYKRISNNTLKLSDSEPYVTMSFIANDFINSENCEFSYQIVDHAEEWIHNANNSNIIITKLPPGKYQLNVKCTNGDQVWSDKIYTLNLDIAYPWWRRDLAYLIYFMLLSGITYIAMSTIRNRIRLNRQILLDKIEKQHQLKIHESKLNFFTNVAHEFFTPLTLIYGPAQHLLEKANLDSYSKRYIHVIRNNADRMQKLISELMEFRKAETGHISLHPEKIDIKEFTAYILDNYIEIAKESKIDFRINIKDTFVFTTDRNTLEKILFNLVSNAFKYTPAGGYIHVDIMQKTGDALFFNIKNSGKGLNKRQMSEIFSRFKIFETSKLQNSKSTGIGLSLTKNLTELLNGKIEVDSVMGEYVEFVVNIYPLPIRDSRSENDEIPEGINEVELITEKKNISILIVEDDKNIRELLKDILFPYYSIKEAYDGKKGLEEVELNMPNIIICDILMPNMDGISFIDSLKSNEKTVHIPVISISAKSSIEDHINAFQHGADLYITKPFHPRHLLIAIENILSKHSTLKKYFNSSHSAITVKDGITLHKEDEELLREIMTFIENNIDDESLSPSSISDFIGISKASLYGKLKDLTNKTPSEYIRIIRLEYASKLLKTTQLTVSEIMYKCGFSSKSYFFKEFSKKFGFSPNEYRKESIK